MKQDLTMHTQSMIHQSSPENIRVWLIVQFLLSCTNVNNGDYNNKEMKILQQPSS